VGIPDPRKPWVAVFQRLDGTAPDGTMVQTIADLFRRGAFGSTSLADYWDAQSLGQIDVGASVVIGWQSSAWDIKTYPGRDSKVDRGQLISHAKRLVPNMPAFRGIIAIYNFQCDGGNQNQDVAWGLSAYGSTPSWARDDWRRCDECFGVLRPAQQGLPCAGGTTHRLGPRRLMTITATDVPKVRRLDECGRCGTLYAADLTAKPTECAAGGKHVSAGAVSVLAGWTDPPADREWSLCPRCRTVVPDWAGTPCSGSASGHEHPSPASIHFPMSDIQRADLSARGFLAHEMGHAYGFGHGRGIEPRAIDLANDCWPSGYGDRFDIMSYGRVHFYEPQPGDPDAGLGRAGPGIAITHLLRSGLLPESELRVANPPTSSPFETLTIRPVTDRGSLGSPGVRFGAYVVQYLRKADWDQDIATGGGGSEPGTVIVRYVPGSDKEVPTTVPAINGESNLGVGDYFLSRRGMGNFSISVDEIEPQGAWARVSFSALGQGPGWRPFGRWLVIPYRASDSTATFDRGELKETLAFAERFWRDMAGPRFATAGGYALSPDAKEDGNGSFLLANTRAEHAARPAADRVAAVVDTALSLPNPVEARQTMPMDWRWFTGLILVGGDGPSAGYLGQLQLDSGVLPAEISCETSDRPRRLSPLIYDVIELGLKTFNPNQLAVEVGRALGFTDVDHPYSLMGKGDGTFLPSAPIVTAAPDPWPIGPSLSTGELNERGWLDDHQTVVVQPPAGGKTSQPKIGDVTLSPVFTASGGRQGIVRAEIGRYELELRSPSGWDHHLRGPVVVAYEAGADPQPLHLGDELTWGSSVPELSGGGRVQVTALSDTAATLAYYAIAKPIIVAGGGHLAGGGTILIGPDGKIHKIPPGDPAPLLQVIQGLNRVQRVVGALLAGIGLAFGSYGVWLLATGDSPGRSEIGLLFLVAAAIAAAILAGVAAGNRNDGEGPRAAA
jgi:hypothetical protein